MINKTFRFFLGMALMLVVAALLAFNGLLLWVATGPRSLEALTPYIESAFHSSSNNYSVKIGSTRLIWDGWRHPVDIRLSQVAVSNSSGDLFTVFPEISMGVDVLYLPLLRIVPSSLAVSAPQMNIGQNADKSFNFGFEPVEAIDNGAAQPTVPFSVLLAGFLSKDASNNFSHLNKITISNAKLTVLDESNTKILNASEVNVKLVRNYGGNIKVTSSASLKYANSQTDINAEFNLKKGDEIIDGGLNFSSLMISDLAYLLPNNDNIKAFEVPISGKMALSIDMNGTVQQSSFDIRGGSGIISSSQLVTPLAVNSFVAKAAFNKDFSELKLESFTAALDGGISVVASGFASHLKGSPAIKADITLKNASADKIDLLWPPTLSPLTREWVTGNITKGKIPEAKLLVDIAQGDLLKPIFPKQAIDANVTMEGMQIRYLPEHPPATNVKGTIHITGLDLSAKIESADYLKDTKLSKGQVAIDDLNADNPYIIVNLKADAPAKDMVHFLGLPRLKHAEKLGLREDGVAGNISGTATVGFNFFSAKGKAAEEGIAYIVKADLKGVSQDAFLDKFDGKNIDGSIDIDNKSINFTGKGNVSGAEVSKLAVKYLFSPEKGYDTFIDVSASADGNAMKRIGYPKFPFLTGNINVNATMKQGKNLESSKADIDLVNAEVTLPDIDWKKPLSEPATLTLTAEKNNGLVKITAFDFAGKTMQATGSATIAKDLSAIDGADFSKLVFNNNDISTLRYAKNNDGTLLQISANRLDLTTMMEKNQKNGEGFSFMNFPAVQFKAYINKLILAKDRVIENLKGDLVCDKEICQNANLVGETGNHKPFVISILKDKKIFVSVQKTSRQLQISSEDAGSFLHNFGILDGMEGGKLSLLGNYTESRNGSTLAATITVGEHNIKNAPLLGKLLSLASLTGFIDTLQGNGIHFKNMSIPFTIHNDVITIEKGKTYGSAIGLTVDGTITMPKKLLNLEGTIVPSYTLNNVIGNVPILGELVGGEDQGVFAARYKIKGSADAPDVSVNPLSILTPGFLRGLFDL